MRRATSARACSGSVLCVSDEFRVEVELDDEEHGYSIGERLRALDVDDEVRQRLGSMVMVTRNGSKLFLYAEADAQAREAERVVRGLVRADGLTAEIAVTRWHPVEESWKDASMPLPATREEEKAEYAAREAAEVREAEVEGTCDWHVVIHLPRRDDAVVLSERLAAEGLPVRRRWRYLIADVVSEEDAQELADRLRSELPDGTDVRIEVDLSDLARSPLQFLPF
jgi:hypothetical protein